MFHIAFFTSTSPSLSCPLAGGKGNVSPPISIGPRIIGGFPSIPRVFFLPHKGISTPTNKAPHTFLATSSSTDYFFSFRVAFRDPKSIPEDASASRWINDRSAQARAGVTRARRGRESAEEERAGEALGRRASRSIVPAYRARAGRRVSPEGRGGTKTRVVLLQHQTTSAHPTDPTDPRDKKRESSCRPAGFTSCRAWGSSGRPRRPSTRARR